MSEESRRRLDQAVTTRRRAQAVAGLRGIAQGRRGAAPQAPARVDEHCGLCNTTVPDTHRHLLHLDERRIVCVCETCWSLRSGDAEFRPCGHRTILLEQFDLPDEVWASLAIPIGLAFFMKSGSVGGVVALYPSPAGATESELDMSSWDDLVARNPILSGLETDAEALVVNRLSEPRQYAIVPIDHCYGLVGMIKSRWEGISGGDAVESAVGDFFGALREDLARR
ncbi:MAG: DUF5947 family protein [Solirubrobacteraceae bacterium]